MTDNILEEGVDIVASMVIMKNMNSLLSSSRRICNTTTNCTLPRNLLEEVVQR